MYWINKTNNETVSISWIIMLVFLNPYPDNLVNPVKISKNIFG